MFGSFPSNEPANSELSSVSRGTFQILVDLIKAGQAAELIKAADPEFLALEKWAMVHGLSMLLLDGMLATKQGEKAIELVQALVKDNLTNIMLKSS